MALLFAVATAAQAQPRLPTNREMHRYDRELDHLEKFCFATNCFSDERFWRESKRVADRAGTGIIHAVLLRGRSWPAGTETGLMFAPLLDLLPRVSASKLLHEYEQSPRASDRLWAHEYLIEFDMSDTKEMVRKLSGSNT